MIELFIEDKRADITEDIQAMLTFAIDDVMPVAGDSNFGSRNSGFSKTLVLPGTARNNKLFGHIFDIKNANPYDSTLPNIELNFNASKAADCVLYQDNIQQIKGTLRLAEIIIDGQIEYEVFITGELAGFSARLGATKLEDLDFSAYDHTYSVANIVDSWLSINGVGVYYPLIDYGNYSVLKHNWDYRTFRPALYVREYLDKIFTGAGYTFDCALFNSTRFRTFVVPNNVKSLTKNTSNILARTTGGVIEFTDGTTIDVLYNTGSLGGFTTSDNIIYTYAGSDVVTADITCLIELSDYTDVPDSIFLTLRKNGVVINSMTVNDNGSYDLSTAGVSLAPSDTLQVRIANIVFGSTIDYYSELSVLSSSSIPTTVLLGDDIQVNDVIPKNILQVEFLSTIVKHSNLYITEDKLKSKHLVIAPFPDFYPTDTSDAVDWTQKLNRAKPIKLKPMSQMNARYYEFKFKQDSDFYSELYRKRYNEGYGDRVFDSEFEFTSAKETVELIFASTPLVGYSGEEKVYPTIFKRTGNAPTYTEENVDSVIRILQAKRITGVTSWNILDGVTVLTSLTEYGYAGHLDDPDAPSNDLNFGVPRELFFELATGDLSVNQFNIYWSAYMSEITDKDSKLLTASFHLTAKDIYELDFSKYVHIDGSLFRLNKILDYNASYPEDCKVELLKVINTDYVSAGSPPVTEAEEFVYVYTADGTESVNLTIPALAGKTILMVVRQTKNVLYYTSTANDLSLCWRLLPANKIRFGTDLGNGEVIQILYQ